jgi:ABC-type glycerol-3-phosphate transport system permease component
MMKSARRTAALLSGIYFLLAASLIAYELSIRLYDRGNSEFAGMLSFGMTLPSSIAVAGLSSKVAGVKVGDSDTAFVVILLIAAIVNAFCLYAVVRRLNRS